MRRFAALCALLLGLCGSAATARPYTVEDLVQTETLGRVVFDPTERWLVIEHQRPYRTAARFDFNQQTAMLLTELLAVDLQRPGAAAPLFPQAADAGYLVGPFAPDGRRMLAYRLRDHSFEAGIVTLATKHVRWLGLTPELANHGAVAQWRSADQVILIARPDGDLPRQMALGWEAQRRLVEAWATTAGGRIPAATAVGSGRFLGIRPKAALPRLVRVDARTGAHTELARGEFIDLALSHDGGWAAVIANGEDLQPTAGDRVYTAFPTRRRRLTLVDLTTGTVRAPCSSCDISLGLLSWSKRSARLLVTARAPGPDGDGKRLLQIDAASGDVHEPLPPQLDLALQPTRNEQAPRARADWMGGDPIVFAAPPRGRPDWYRLRENGPINLTAGLEAPPRQLAALGERHMHLVSGGVAWRIDETGRRRQLARAPHLRLIASRPEPGARLENNPRLFGDGMTLADEARLIRLEPGRRIDLKLPAGVDQIAVGAGHVVTLSKGPGGRRRLDLGTWKGCWTPVLTMNAVLGDVVPAEVAPVRHRGPGGQPLISWLYLPAHRAPGARLPLVVIPYRGSSFATPAAGYEVGAFTAYLNPQILAARGYAVLTPSLPYDDASGEPSAGMADQILQAADAAIAAYGLDPARIALWGHSFGGSNAVAAAAQSPRFKSIIAVSGMHDIISRWGAFPIHRWVVPEDIASIGPPGTVEQAQAHTGAPPFADPQRYVRNSNIFAADKITAPVLLIHGETDELRVEQSQEMFTALHRQGKDAVMVTYWGEGHALSSPANIRDYYGRILAWLEETLPPQDGERASSAAAH